MRTPKAKSLIKKSFVIVLCTIGSSLAINLLEFGPLLESPGGLIDFRQVVLGIVNKCGSMVKGQRL